MRKPSSLQSRVAPARAAVKVPAARKQTDAQQVTIAAWHFGWQLLYAATFASDRTSTPSATENEYSSLVQGLRTDARPHAGQRDRSGAKTQMAECAKRRRVTGSGSVRLRILRRSSCWSLAVGRICTRGLRRWPGQLKRAKLMQTRSPGALDS